MKKVYYSALAAEDLEDIFYGLALWEKHHLELSEVISYVRAIRRECDNIGKAIIHQKCKYEIHKRYGTYVSSYRRTPLTVWYFIYNIDKEENIRIEKIINNYITNQ